MAPEMITLSISSLLFLQRAMTLQRLVDFSKSFHENNNFRVDGDHDEDDNNHQDEPENVEESDSVARYNAGIDKIASAVAYGENGSTSYQCLKIVKGCADNLKYKSLQDKKKMRHMDQRDPSNPVLKLKDKQTLSASQFRAGIDKIVAELDTLMEKVLIGFNGVRKSDFDPTLLQDDLSNDTVGYGLVNDSENKCFVKNEDVLVKFFHTNQAARNQFFLKTKKSRSILNEHGIQYWINQVDKIWELFMMLIVLLCGGSPRMTELELMTLTNSSESPRSLRILKERIGFQLYSTKSKDTSGKSVARFIAKDIANKLLYCLGVIRPCYM
jgi:hypothetical protein